MPLSEALYLSYSTKLFNHLILFQLWMDLTTDSSRSRENEGNNGRTTMKQWGIAKLHSSHSGRFSEGQSKEFLVLACVSLCLDVGCLSSGSSPCSISAQALQTLIARPFLQLQYITHLPACYSTVCAHSASVNLRPLQASQRFQASYSSPSSIPCLNQLPHLFLHSYSLVALNN